MSAPRTRGAGSAAPPGLIKVPRKSLRGQGGRRNGRTLSTEKSKKDGFTARWRKSPPVPAEEQLRAGHTCSRWASCPYASGETAQGGESDRPACARKRLPLPTQASPAPTLGPC